MRRVAAIGALACVAFLAVSGASASAAQSRNYTGTSFGPGGASGSESFVSVQGVAVDPADGDVYVFDGGEGKVYKFDSAGDPVDFATTGTNSVEGAGTAGSGEGELAIAPPGSPGAAAGDLYVATIAKVAVYSPAGEPIGELTAAEAGGETCGVATDPSGHIFVNVFDNGIHEYVPKANPFKAEDETDHSASELREIGACNVAADGLGNFYAASFNGNNGTVKLEGLADPEPSVVDSSANTIAVASGSNDLYADRRDEIRQYDSAGKLLGSFGSGELSESVGIALSPDAAKAYVGTPTRVRIYGPSLTLPEAETRTPTEVTGGSAVLNGTINADGGPPATCVFEYVEADAKGFEGAATASCSPAGSYSGNGPVVVSAQIGGLAEGFYRVRLVARNESGPVAGNTVVFENSAPVAATLPDGRSYELVSPAQKGGEVIPPLGVESCRGECPGENSAILPMQAAPDGESIVYEGLPFGVGLAPEFDQYLGQRSSSGWGTTSFSSATVTGEWRAFSADLSRGVLYQVKPALSLATPARGGTPFADLYLVSEGGSPLPLVTVEPPHREPGNTSNVFRIRYAAANSGTLGVSPFTHLVFEANDTLTPAVPGVAPPAPEVAAGEKCTVSYCDLYEWQGGALHLINVLPGNTTAAAEAVIGSGKILDSSVEEVPVVSNAVSADGSRVFWTDAATGQTYVRVGGAETLPIPGPATCKESEPLAERACFLTASADGTRVLLSNGQIYELDSSGGAYEPGPDLTQGDGGFQGILGSSEDLSRIYFVDTAELTGAEENANHERAEPGALNLYLGQEEKGPEEPEVSPRFIGALHASDLEFGGAAGTWKPAPSNRTAQVTTDGGDLAFMSSAPLTGYDNVGPCGFFNEKVVDAPCSEVFLYDSATNRLTCASCDPSGQPPLGRSNLSLLSSKLGEPPALRQPGNLSVGGDGRLFFESEDVLSSRDLNGSVADIYQWEPGGFGSCNRGAGCVSLISSGTSPNPSLFLDSTPSGNDAFFITRSQLVPRDKDDQYDVYDARVGGGFAEEASSSCVGEACKGHSSGPPLQQAPASSTFAGPGNGKPACKRDFVRKHGKCVKRPHKKHKNKNKQNKKKNEDKRAGHGRGGAR